MTRQNRSFTGSMGWSLGKLAAVGSSTALAAAAGVWLSLAASPPLAAAGLRAVGHDQDGDGLCDELEAGLGTGASWVDSDFDGWNDAEEFARSSSPLKGFLHPGDAVASVGMGAYLRDGDLYTLVAIYAKDGTMAGKTFDIGVMISGQLTILPPSSYMRSAEITTAPTQTPGELVFLCAVPISKKPLERLGAMSIFSVLSVGPGQVVAAAAVNLVSHGGGITQVLSSRDPNSPNSPGGGGGGGGGGAGGGPTSVGPSVIYRPIGGGNVPASWTPGQICFQSLSPVGAVGAVVTNEVTSASCQGGWDGYCDASSCAASVGSTVQMLDPGALIGG